METTIGHSGAKEILRRIILSKVFLIAVGALLLYTLAGFFLVPYVIKQQAIKVIALDLNRHLTIEEVATNPYTFTLSIKNFDLKEQDATPILGFRDLFVNFELFATLKNWAFTFALLRLDDPRINVVMRKDGKLNLLELAAAAAGEAPSKPQEESPPTRMILRQFLIQSGSVDITDDRVSTPAKVTLQPLNLEIKDLTTLPERRGPYTVAATLPDGAAARWRGEVSLHPVWSEGTLSLEKIKVATLWQFLQDQVLIKKPEGSFDLELRYRFALAGEQPHLDVDRLGLRLSDLALGPRDKPETLLQMARVDVQEGRFNLDTRELSIGRVEVEKGKLSASMAENGRINWQDLFVLSGEGSQPKPSTEASSPETPWRAVVKQVDVKEVAADFLDQSRLDPIRISLGKVQVSLSTSLEISPRTMQAVVEGLSAGLYDVALRPQSGTEPMLQVGAVETRGGSFNLLEKKISIEQLEVRGGLARASLDEKGGVDWLKLMELKVPPAQAEAPPSATHEPVWQLGVGTAEVSDFGAQVTDRRFPNPVQLDLERLHFKLSGFHFPQKNPLPFEFQTVLKQGGEIFASGEVLSLAPSLETNVKVSDLFLPAFQSYFLSFPAITLDSGTVSAEGKVKYALKGDSNELTFDGNATLSQFHLKEVKTGQTLVAWSRLQNDGIKFSLSPMRMDIHEVRLVELGAKLIINEDGTINIREVLKPGSEATSERKQPAKEEKLPPIKVRRVLLERGKLQYTDLLLRPQFSALIHELKGVISGLSTDSKSLAGMKLDGRVDEYGLAKIDGALNPFDPKANTEVKLVFRNVEMTSLTPYSARFAGYRIASGKLSVDVQYKIKDSKLLGDHRIIMDRLTLGERVESPGAMNLPLDLALALLKDADGKIELGLPVSGDIGDPQFSYGQLILKAIVNLFTKIVTAPFAMIGRLMGVESENLDSVGFEPGSVVLPPPEREKLKQLAEALKKRPNLKMDIQGRFDAKADAEAMKSLSLRWSIAGHAGVQLKPDEDPGPIDFTDPKSQKALETIYRERFSPDALRQLKKQIRESEGEKKPQAPAKEGDVDPDLYQKIYGKLFETEPLEDAKIQETARQRAEAIRLEMSGPGGLEASRISVLEPAAAKDLMDGMVPSTLALGAVK
ncbi:MAG: DUF748 domain-containing protein [Desulfobacterota bacterium]|nr:DUF748 domain-containing protein [Thermodesulfobacteriota bacterium]